MPEPSFSATSHNFCMGHLILGMNTPDNEQALYHPGKWLMGYILPPFQRPLVWTESQMIRFVESAWKGFHLGFWMYNDTADTPSKGGIFHHMDRWLIDGQQRLHALHAYLNDAFPVFGYRWSELTLLDHRRFNNISFGAGSVSMADETALRKLYDALNFGGTPHEESMRASPAQE